MKINLLKKYFYAFSGTLMITLIYYKVFNGAISENTDVTKILLSPTWGSFLGTDSLGRDLLSRVMIGGFNSLWVGVLAALISVFFGSIVGLSAGWFGGACEKIIMAIVQLMSSLPSFLVVSFLGFSLFEIWTPSTFWGQSICLIAMISTTHWMGTARLVRAQVKELKSKVFVEAAIALGGSSNYILRVHLLPHLRSVLLLQFGQLIPLCIIYESFVSFIGYGFQSPETSWGLLIQDGWKSLSQFPHLMLSPILFLFITVFSLNLYLEAMIRSKSRTLEESSF